MTSIPVTPRTYYVAGRAQATGPVLAVLIDGLGDKAGVGYFRSALAISPGVGVSRAMPIGPVHDLINRFGAVAIVITAPLPDPTGGVRPARHHIPAAHHIHAADSGIRHFRLGGAGHERAM